MSHKEWRSICGHVGFPTRSITVKPHLEFSSFRDDYDECVGVGAVCDGGGNRAIDLSTVTCPSWLKTDVRGRKCIGAYEAAETLAYLSVYSKYFCGESNGVSPKKDEPIDAFESLETHQRLEDVGRCFD